MVKAVCSHRARLCLVCFFKRQSANVCLKTYFALAVKGWCWPSDNKTTSCATNALNWRCASTSTNKGRSKLPAVAVGFDGATFTTCQSQHDAPFALGKVLAGLAERIGKCWLADAALLRHKGLHQFWNGFDFRIIFKIYFLIKIQINSKLIRIYAQTIYIFELISSS